MRKYFRILIGNLKSILSFNKLFVTSVIFVFLFCLKVNVEDNINSFKAFITMSFYGPNNLSDNIMEVLTWSLYQFYLIYVIGQYWYNELKIRSMYTVLRINCKQTWNLCLQFTIFIICIAYFLFGIIIGLITKYIFNIKIGLYNIQGGISIFFILIFSSYYIVTTYILCMVATKKHNLSFIILVIMLYLSIGFGSIFKIDKLIPFNQGIISKHFISGFSFRWSFIYLLIMITINIIITNRLINRTDFTEIIQ